MTTSTAASAVGTSRSDDSAGMPASKSTGSVSSQRSISSTSLYKELGHDKLRAFDYDELKGANDDFGRAQKVGKGGFGCVYKGSVRPLDDKGDHHVAVKRLHQRGLLRLRRAPSKVKPH